MKKLFKKNLWLVLILLIGLGIRLVGVYPGYPPIHPDESMSYSTAVEMIIRGDINPRRFDYPAGVPLLHMFIYRIFFLPLSLIKVFIPHPKVFLTALKIGPRFLDEFQQAIFGSRQNDALIWSRYINAFLGTGTVWLTFLLAKRLFNQTTGLLAAFFLAVNYRHVLSSHFALSDAPNAFFAVLAVYAASLILAKPAWRHYLAAGIGAGMFFSIKYQSFSFLPLFFAHLATSLRQKSFKVLFRPAAFLAAILIPIIFSALNPYFVSHLQEALAVAKYVSLRYGFGAQRFYFYPLFYLFYWGIGPLAAIAIVFGAVLSFLTKPLKSSFLLSFVAPFFFVFVYYSRGGGYVRNFVTVMPFLMIFAGFGLAMVLQKIRWPWLYLMVMIIINFYPLKNSLILDWAYARPYNWSVYQRWLDQNIPEGIQLRAMALYLPGQAELEKRISIVNWDISRDNCLAEFREEGDDFFSLNATRYYSWLYWWSDLPSGLLVQNLGLPLEFLKNSYQGLALEEFLGYTVAEVYKPWQAADEINYLLVKVPRVKTEPEGLTKVTEFDFKDEKEAWQVKGQFGQPAEGFKWSDEQMVIEGGRGGHATIRWASPPIEIFPDKYYQVKARLKNSTVLPQEKRDGFLRLDFYPDLASARSEAVGTRVALSSRAWGKDDWQEKTAEVVAPQDARYLTISFQRSNLALPFASYLDRAILFESDQPPVEPFGQLPYIKPTIPDDVLFPNSVL